MYLGFAFVKVVITYNECMINYENNLFYIISVIGSYVTRNIISHSTGPMRNAESF